MVFALRPEIPGQLQPPVCAADSLGNGVLQSLRLHGNALTMLPAAIGERSSQSLALGGNRLRVLPLELCALSALETLGLNSNQLSRLPPCGRLQALRPWPWMA